MPLVQSSFVPPEFANLDGFSLEVLGPRHAEADFLAVSSSKEQIRHVFGPENGWPDAEITFEQNLADLTRHADEFDRRDAFAYAILKSPVEYVGCLYIKPVKSHIAQDRRKTLFDAQAFFWLSSGRSSLSEASVHAELARWLDAHWPFRTVAWPGRAQSWVEWKLMAEPSC
jgi:hypothetical protein